MSYRNRLSRSKKSTELVLQPSKPAATIKERP